MVHNVDVISTIDLRRMVQFHLENRALATLAVQVAREFSLSAVRRAAAALRHGDRSDGRAGLCIVQELAFCGVHVISPRLFAKMTEEGAFSIIDCYLRLAARRKDPRLSCGRILLARSGHAGEAEASRAGQGISVIRCLNNNSPFAISNQRSHPINRYFLQGLKARFFFARASARPRSCTDAGNGIPFKVLG